MSSTQPCPNPPPTPPPRTRRIPLFLLLVVLALLATTTSVAGAANAPQLPRRETYYGMLRRRLLNGILNEKHRRDMVEKRHAEAAPAPDPRRIEKREAEAGPRRIEKREARRIEKRDVVLEERDPRRIEKREARRIEKRENVVLEERDPRRIEKRDPRRIEKRNPQRIEKRQDVQIQGFFDDEEVARIQVIDEEGAITVAGSADASDAYRGPVLLSINPVIGTGGGQEPKLVRRDLPQLWRRGGGKAASPSPAPQAEGQTVPWVTEAPQLPPKANGSDRAEKKEFKDDGQGGKEMEADDPAPEQPGEDGGKNPDEEEPKNPDEEAPKNPDEEAPKNPDEGEGDAPKDPGSGDEPSEPTDPGSGDEPSEPTDPPAENPIDAPEEPDPSPDPEVGDKISLLPFPSISESFADEELFTRPAQSPSPSDSPLTTILSSSPSPSPTTEPVGNTPSVSPSPSIPPPPPLPSFSPSASPVSPEPSPKPPAGGKTTVTYKTTVKNGYPGCALARDTGNNLCQRAAALVNGHDSGACIEANVL
ncbi:hypothetical protein HDU96_009413 [Phlyctochytrium bullatum]|nr:hypothetical protein HDU96_009413 [Phlyctochytrium bullatum]